MPLGKDNLSDEFLLEEYKRTSDVKILGQLYEPYMPMVYGVCLKYLKNREESRDAVMQIFEKLIATLKIHEVNNFKSWLYVTSRNYCLMQIRSSKSKYFEDIGAIDVEFSAFGHHEGDNEQELNISKLQRCIEELGDEQKRCVRLFYLEQKCYKEITAMTGYEDHKVKSYIQNGKRNLKLCMERNG